MSTTYNDLVNNVKAYSGRTDSQTINNIPQFIAAAQSALDSTLRIGTMISTVTYNTDETSVDASEFMKIDSVSLSGLVGVATTYRDITTLRELVNTRPETIGYDFHYAMNGNYVELVKPAPLTLTGYKKPPRISSNLQTNAYTDGAENALLWLSLYYCAKFGKDADGADGWKTMAVDEVTQLNSTRDQFAKTGTAKVKRRGYF